MEKNTEYKSFAFLVILAVVEITLSGFYLFFLLSLGLGRSGAERETEYARGGVFLPPKGNQKGEKIEKMLNGFEILTFS